MTTPEPPGEGRTRVQLDDEGVRQLIEQHRQLLDRLARDGDCLACTTVADGLGCPAHRAPDVDAPDRSAWELAGDLFNAIQDLRTPARRVLDSSPFARPKNAQAVVEGLDGLMDLVQALTRQLAVRSTRTPPPGRRLTIDLDAPHGFLYAGRPDGPNPGGSRDECACGRQRSDRLHSTRSGPPGYTLHSSTESENLSAESAPDTPSPTTDSAKVLVGSVRLVGRGTREVSSPVALALKMVDQACRDERIVACVGLPDEGPSSIDGAGERDHVDVMHGSDFVSLQLPFYGAPGAAPAWAISAFTPAQARLVGMSLIRQADSAETRPSTDGQSAPEPPAQPAYSPFDFERMTDLDVTTDLDEARAAGDEARVEQLVPELLRREFEYDARKAKIVAARRRAADLYAVPELAALRGMVKLPFDVKGVCSYCERTDPPGAHYPDCPWVTWARQYDPENEHL